MLPTVVVLDFDDTIFPTRWLQQKGSVEVIGDDEATMARVDSSVMALLASIRALPSVHRYIVTTAREAWVRGMVARHLPQCAPLLDDWAIVSARERYEGRWPAEKHGQRASVAWKYMTFLDICRAVGPLPGLDFIIIGDSDCERLAGQHLQKAIADNASGVVPGLPATVRVKTILLIEGPTGAQIASQIAALTTVIRDVVASPVEMSDTIRAIVRTHAGELPITARF